MRYDKDMIGPDAILAKFVQTGKIPHALLFTGQNDELKTKAAFDFINSLMPAHAQPFDFLHVDDSPIPIEKVRSIRQRFADGPLIGPYKVALIAKAGDLRPDAANTFLKILEEPPPRSLFILIAPSRSSVLVTIASRALEVRFPRIIQMPVQTVQEKHVCEIFENGSLNEKFRAAQKYNLKNKLELLNVLDAWLVRLHSGLYAPRAIRFSAIPMRKIFELRKIVSSSNANPQLLLEELFIAGF